MSVVAVELKKQLQELLYHALGQPIGLLVETNDVPRLRQRLLATRSQLKDRALSCLSIRASPWSSDQLVIVKTARGLAESNQELAAERAEWERKGQQ